MIFKCAYFVLQVERTSSLTAIAEVRKYTFGQNSTVNVNVVFKAKRRQGGKTSVNLLCRIRALPFFT
jgi:hypothetical protein